LVQDRDEIVQVERLGHAKTRSAAPEMLIHHPALSKLVEIFLGEGRIDDTGIPNGCVNRKIF
jgi:hypothetical protein